MLILKLLNTVGCYFSLMYRVFSRPDKWSIFFKQLPKEMEKLGLNSLSIVPNYLT